MRVFACLILLAAAIPVSAQTKPGAMQKRAMASEEGHFIQLTGFGSFNLGKDLYQAGGAQLGLDDGSGWGGRVACVLPVWTGWVPVKRVNPTPATT